MIPFDAFDKTFISVLRSGWSGGRISSKDLTCSIFHFSSNCILSCESPFLCLSTSQNQKLEFAFLLNFIIVERQKVMTKRYTKAYIQAEFSRWCRGVIGSKTMSKNEYNALKKRCSRAGLTRNPRDFHLSTKLSASDYNAARRIYHRHWRTTRALRTRIRNERERMIRQSQVIELRNAAQWYWCNISQYKQVFHTLDMYSMIL